VNWLLKILVPGSSTKVPTERDLAVRALVARCARLTTSEAWSLADEWAAIEDDDIVRAAIAEGCRKAGHYANAAADDADWAFRWTLRMPSDHAIYAPLDPDFGRAIEAIRAHTTAIAARERIPTDVAEAMSGPWHAAISSE